MERATAVLTLYEQAATLLAAGVWVVCVDEKTLIQARAGVEAPTPALPGHHVQVAARYVRRGAVQVFAALSVADGLVYGCCRARKRFCDFQSFLEEVVVPKARRRQVREVRLILDQGSTHAPKQLEGWLAQQQATQPWPFSVHVVWLPKYASWLDQLEIWFNVLQRKLLTPNHFAHCDLLIQAILDFMAHYNRSASPINWSYTVDRLQANFATN